jgi:hypothetical protein
MMMAEQTKTNRQGLWPSFSTVMIEKMLGLRPQIDMRGVRGNLIIIKAPGRFYRKASGGGGI